MSRIFATANRRFFATNIVVSLGGKFAASLPRGEDRRQHRPPERPHLERRDPRGRRPAGRSDHVLELPGVLPHRPHHPGRPLHGSRGEADRLLAPHAGADRTVGQRLDEEEGVGGTGTGERRNDVEQFLAGELGHLPEGGEDLPGPLLLFPRNPPGEEEAGAPHPHLSRSVRHRADDAGALPQGGQKSPGRNPRGDRDEELALRFARTDLAEHLSHALRLHREDDRVAFPEEVRHPFRDGNAEPMPKLLSPLRADLQHDHFPGRDELRRKDPPDHRLPHVSRPDESQSLHPSLLARLPKIAVPTRTIVAPSSIAASKSLDIPIDSSVIPKPAPPRETHSANRSRSRTKYGRLSSGSSVHGGMAISPRRRMPGSPGAASISAGSSLGTSPALVSSPARFTSKRTGTTFPASVARRDISPRSARESTVWIHEKSATVFFTLFLWSFPTRCHSAPGKARIFPSASWT